MNEARGRHMKKIADANHKIIKEWFDANKDNPDATMKDCEAQTGLSAITVRKHLRAIKEAE